VTNAEYAADDPLPEPARPCPGAALYRADCRDVLPLLPSGSFDLVFTDPPYPEISRSYGRWTEAEWWDLMRAVVPECMRVLKPTGSAVFVLQPNSERVGRMRTWLWEFMAWVGKEWGIIQDVYWWNISAIACGGAAGVGGVRGLLKASAKACVWVGPADCWRRQEAVLQDETLANAQGRVGARAARKDGPSGQGAHERRIREAPLRRGGAIPFNVLPLSNAEYQHSAAGCGHGAGIPLALCSFWVRYLCPPGGSVLDPFSGTATTGLAALKHGCDYVGIERVPGHHATARRRLADAAGPLFATPAAVDASPPAVG
jgi:hypothetical protein